MAQVTKAELVARIEALEEEVAALKSAPAPEAPVSFVMSVDAKPSSLPGAIDFNEMAENQGFSYAYSDPYDDSDWWGANRYL